MKLFQQLLVAPAALGLFAPLAANAAEVNLSGIADYAGYEETLETDLDVSASQFSDVVPGDWAYTALQNISESYGCVDSGYAKNLKSGQALTRYEAASLVNSCLDGGIASADNADAIRLSNEFGTEMAILKGRVDGLEYKVKELSAGQFSSATKMSGEAVFTTHIVDRAADVLDDKLVFNYAYKLDLNSSFTGSDLLTAKFETGNAPANGNYQLDSSVDPVNADNAIELARLWYSFPVGDDFQVTVGPRIAQDDILAATTGVYSDAFKISAMGFSTSATVGPGLAVEYVNDSGFNATLSTIAFGGENAQTGIWTNDSQDINTVAVGYDGDNFGGGVIYTQQDQGSAVTNHNSTFGVGVYFTPDDFPTVSATYDTYQFASAADSSEFTLGLDWDLGPGTASAAYQALDTQGTNTSNYEIYYNYPVTDGIAVQGGMFVTGMANADDTVGYAVETFFTF